jgi:Mg-chelatase subunit ChlD
MNMIKTACAVSLSLTTMVMAGCSASAPPQPPAPAGNQQLVAARTSGSDPQSGDEQQIASNDSSTASAQSKDKICLTRNFYFVFDGSGSMAAPPRGGTGEQAGRSKIAGAKWAVHEFMKKVPNDVNLGLYVFDRGGSRQVIPLGPNNRDKFLAAIDRVSAHGATPLGAAINTGSQQLASQYKRQLGYGEFRLIVITDGEATDNLAKGVNAADRMQIPIYTIGFDMDEEHALRRNSISYRSADSAEQVERALEEAGAELDVFDPTAFPQQTTTKKRRPS